MTDPLISIKSDIAQALQGLFGVEVDTADIQLSETKKEFEGHYTWVVFPFASILKSSPQDIAQRVGKSLTLKESSVVRSFNVIKGFLNLELKNQFWKSALNEIQATDHYGSQPSNGQKVMVEFASPNTNKPLHLGHIRNILLGWSASQLLEYCGYQVIKTQIINDRGIAICKSMLAWKKFGHGEDPAGSGIKGDHLVGKYYRKFENALSEEYAAWQESTDARKEYTERLTKEQSEKAFFKEYKNTYFNVHSTLGGEAKTLLLKWEARDVEVIQLWRTMNQWVYDGFEKTYASLGVTFDHLYYESETYLLGKDIIQNGLDEGHFYRLDDDSVWVNLEEVGLDKKILLRSDGTSVYMTQDMGTAHKRYKDHQAKNMIYVVADEQDYHFQVLFEIMKKLGEPYAEGLYHLSYGMVDLPSGRMKSREGTVVDADDLIEEVIDAVRISSKERGELEDMSDEEREALYTTIALAAIKFFILRVNPKRRMTFNPEESVDIQGQTGPYIQNAYVRIRSILRRYNGAYSADDSNYTALHPSETDILQSLLNFPAEVNKAALSYDPSIIATFAYELAKKFHKFYHDVRILNAESEDAQNFRIKLISNVADVLKISLKLLGIEMPERM